MFEESPQQPARALESRAKYDNNNDIITSNIWNLFVITDDIMYL